MAEVAIDELKALIGQEIGLSDWLTIDQATVDAFADATGDRQFIHVDPAAAAMTPFGGTIAHGFLLLSLMPRLSVDADLPRPAGLAMIVNYGGERTRFIAPVRTGSRVRARFTLQSLAEKRPGQWQQITTYTLEIEGEDKPAVIADWVSLLVTHP